MPTGLSEEVLNQIGASSPAQLAWSGTPVRARVVEPIAGTTTDSVVMLEIGCVGEGSMASTTVGERLLVMLDASDKIAGPSSLFGGTHRIVDWFAISDEGNLQPRTGVFGAPPTAPFISGMTLDEATDLLASR